MRDSICGRLVDPTIQWYLDLVDISESPTERRARPSQGLLLELPVLG